MTAITAGSTVNTAAGGGGGGGDITPDAIDWVSIYEPGSQSGNTNAVTLSGVTTGITVSASKTGSVLVTFGYAYNGVFNAYTGPFSWMLGDTLVWYVSAPFVGTPTNYSGTVTVNNDSLGAGHTLDTFTFLVHDQST